MKTVFTLLFVASSLTMLRAQTPEQRPAPALKPENSEAVRTIVPLRLEAEKVRDEYADIVEARDTDLTDELQRALDNRDQTMIEVAIQDVKQNKRNLDAVGDRLSKALGSLMNATRVQYRAHTIKEERYVDELNFSRDVERLMKKAPADHLLGGLDEAHCKWKTEVVYQQFLTAPCPRQQ